MNKYDITEESQLEEDLDIDDGDTVNMWVIEFMSFLGLYIWKLTYIMA